MDEFLILILLALVVFIFVFPIVALVRSVTASREARDARERTERLSELVQAQQQRIRKLEDRLADPGAKPAASTPPEEEVVLPVTPPVVAAPRDAGSEPNRPDLDPPPLPPAVPPVSPPPHWTAEESLPQADVPSYNVWKPRSKEAEETGVPDAGEPLPRPAEPSFSIEQFLGVKLFAWLGGVAVFFGVIFFVKYAFEHNLIPPATRVAIGFVTGIGLLAGGLWIHRHERYRVLAQALCATGVLVLYGVSFAAHAVYRFPAFGPAVTFAVMSLVTVCAFLVAVRLDALVVAVLGMLGGFLTPVLLPTVQDHPFALFSYIALLDAGLLAVTWRGRWIWLRGAAATGTVLMQVGWVARHFVPGQYFEGSATLVPMGILLFFGAMFLAAAWLGRREVEESDEEEMHATVPAITLLLAATGFSFYFLHFDGITGRPWLLYGFILALNLGAIGIGWIRPRFGWVPAAFGAITFLHLVVWTFECLVPATLGWTLAAYLVLGGLHAAWPVLSDRLRPGTTGGLPRGVTAWLPLVTVAMMLLPVVVMPEVSFLIWPAVLLANLLVIGLAVATGALLPVLAALVLTLGVAAAWLLRVPAEITSLPPLLAVVVFFSLFFALAGFWLGKRAKSAMPELPGLSLDPAKVLPAAAGALPFVLLVMMVARLPVANPTPVFGAGLLLAVLLLGLASASRQTTVLAPAAALGVMALEGAWHALRFDPGQPGTALGWYLGFYVIFIACPFVHRRLRGEHTDPWIASALAGIGHFMLVHDLVRRAWPNEMMGLLPAAFALPALLSLFAVIRGAPAMDRATQVRLSWTGGVALLFITLIFPIQFDRQWLTVAWALEGAALVWLFRRVPHRGLLWTGLGLLAVSFVRLALNPAVFTAYPRSGTAIWNWHLYAYGVVAASQFLAARWLPAQHRNFERIDLGAVLWSLGGVLLFLLLNIQIADLFTPAGERFVAFQFAGNFARDMTYTISWGLFALALLVIGIAREVRGARLAAVGLLVVTLLKLFLHDLANIENIYRIAALIATGVIAFLASFLYQRFFSRAAKP